MEKKSFKKEVKKLNNAAITNVVVTATEGGTPITEELAIELRQLIFGSSIAPPRGEWTRTGFVFQPAGQELSYGLQCPRNGTRGMHSVLQGFILKYILFDKNLQACGYSAEKALLVQESTQIEALIASMTESLKQIAGKNSVIMTIPGETTFVNQTAQYFQDTVSEKLLLYELKKEELIRFLRTNIHHFTTDPGPGSLLLLYSAVLTRTLPKIRMDMDCLKGSYIVGPLEEGSLNIVTLLLTGRASPHLHNGVLHVGNDKLYAVAQYGVLNRTMIGLLLYKSGDSPDPEFQPGSRLKTPTLPIWITNCEGHYGVLFNLNKDLLKNYHAESRFDLYYYSCSGVQMTMTIDNRNHTERATHMLKKQASITNANALPEKDGDPTTAIERLIITKWEEARATFHSQPSTLSYLFNAQN